MSVRVCARPSGKPLSCGPPLPQRSSSLSPTLGHFCVLGRGKAAARGAAVDVMELMFAEWEDGERFSFEDSDRFEEDSLCSFISEAESLCQNWRGWRKQSAGPNSPTVRAKGKTPRPEQRHLWSRGEARSRGPTSKLCLCSLSGG